MELKNALGKWCVTSVGERDIKNPHVQMKLHVLFVNDQAIMPKSVKDCHVCIVKENIFHGSVHY